MWLFGMPLQGVIKLELLCQLQGYSTATLAPLDLASVPADQKRLAADVSSLQSQLETAKTWGVELKQDGD